MAPTTWRSSCASLAARSSRRDRRNWNNRQNTTSLAFGPPGGCRARGCIERRRHQSPDRALKDVEPGHRCSRSPAAQAKLRTSPNATSASAEIIRFRPEVFARRSVWSAAMINCSTEGPCSNTEDWPRLSFSAPSQDGSSPPARRRSRWPSPNRFSVWERPPTKARSRRPKRHQEHRGVLGHGTVGDRGCRAARCHKVASGNDWARRRYGFFIRISGRREFLGTVSLGGSYRSRLMEDSVSLPGLFRSRTEPAGQGGVNEASYVSTQG